MTAERWGSLSVKDHIDAASLAANVLLYDRVVVPVLTEQPDRNELAYWAEHGWNPALQHVRLEQLGDRAVKRPWDQSLRAAYRSRFEELQAEREDASEIDGYGLTRRILAQDSHLERPAGVHHYHVIAAYNSEKAMRTEFDVRDRSENIARQAYLLTRKLAVPDLADPEDSLRAAIELSRDESFQAKRTDLFDWQQKAISQGYTPEAAVAHVADLADKYNDKVEAAVGRVKWRFAFMIGGVALGLAGSLVSPIALAGAALTLVQFATLDLKPAIRQDRNDAAAMFHDVKVTLGAQIE